MKHEKHLEQNLVYRKPWADVVADISGSSDVTKSDPVKPQLENLEVIIMQSLKWCPFRFQFCFNLLEGKYF